MESSMEENSERNIEDINAILGFAKYSPEDFKSDVQCISFSNDLDNENVKLLELDQKILDAFTGGERIEIRGDGSESAVLVTESSTYEIKEAETSNSLLLLPQLSFGEDLLSEGEQKIVHREVCSVIHNYYELRPIKPKLKKLRTLLEENPYRGRECEGDEDDTGRKLSLAQLKNSIQASNDQINTGLHKLNACEIDGAWRLLDFDYLTTVLHHIIQLSEERDWFDTGLDEAECCQVLEDLFPRKVILHIIHCFVRDCSENESEAESKSQKKFLCEDKICKHFAELCLRNSGRFNLNDFLRTWQESVPAGMKTYLSQLEKACCQTLQYAIPTLHPIQSKDVLFSGSQLKPASDEISRGMALTDKESHPPVVWYYRVEDLPEDVSERFQALFEERTKWSLEEITPYIKDLTSEKIDVGALLTKYSRASLQNGIKVFSSRQNK